MNFCLEFNKRQSRLYRFGYTLNFIFLVNEYKKGNKSNRELCNRLNYSKLVFLGLFSLGSTQVIENDVILSTQADVTAFSGTSISGYLAISGSDIVDLTALSTLTSVMGGLYVQLNDSLTNLAGLSSLTYVGG